MLRCIGSSSPGRVADRFQKRGDGRIEMFFIRLRYTIWAYLNQLKRQEKGKRPRTPLEGKSIDSPQSSPLASPEVPPQPSQVSPQGIIQPIQPLVSVQIGSRFSRPTVLRAKDGLKGSGAGSGSGSLVQCDPMETDCLYEDELDGIGGVVVGALEDIGKSLNRFTGGLRRFHGDLKKFVNSGTNLLIG